MHTENKKLNRLKTNSFIMKSEKYLNDKIVINRWIFFCFNYPYDFIEKCWADNPMMARHIRSKFQGDVNALYCELDKDNCRRLIEWVLDNYNDERRVFG